MVIYWTLTVLLLSPFFIQAETDLDAFLKKSGYHLTPAGTAIYEGYITPKQRDAFIDELRAHPELRKIAEVGFNAGHTAEIFLEYVPGSHVVSFDINSHPYTNVGVAFMTGKYKDRFWFVEGDSHDSIKNFYQAHPDSQFDLIYIDGCHRFGACLADIFNFKSLARPNSILWVDDFNFPEVKSAVEFAERLRIIQIVKSASVQDEFGIRSWVECCYTTIFK